MSVPQYEIDEGADMISACFESGLPFFIGRNGSTEMELLEFWQMYRRTGTPWPPALLEKLQRYSGVFPATPESIDDWVEAYTDSLCLVDGLAAGWYKPFASSEAALLDTFCPKAFRTPLRSLEPYYVEPNRRWTKRLAGKKIAVVSSFAESIQRQVSRAGTAVAIWSSVKEPETILHPTAKWHTVRSHFPSIISCGDQTGWGGLGTWQEAVNQLAEEVLAICPDIAIIGCGGLGMILAAKLRKAGISCILLGGAIQVLFGIKGRRWATHDIISEFWNSHWVWPSGEEVPAAAYKIEGGCYWGGSRPSTTPR